MIQSFLEIKYPYNQICNSCNTWINHNDLWKFILGLEKLSNESINLITETNPDKECLNVKNCNCFNEVLNNYYFNNWNGCNIDELRDETLILLLRLVIFSCTKGKDFNKINNALEKIRCKNNILLSLSKIDTLHVNTDRVLKLYVDAAKEVLPNDIVQDIRIKIMELKLK